MSMADSSKQAAFLAWRLGPAMNEYANLLIGSQLRRLTSTV